MTKDQIKFWHGKKVFLTGHTGFKGSWAALLLSSLGAKVKGYSLPPSTEPSLFNILNLSEIVQSEFGDVRDLNTLRKSIKLFSPDIVIHMAAQPLVRLSYEDPVETYSTNVMGTVNILEATRDVNNVAAILNVTTDKCYENREWLWGYRETEPMGGHDPYSSSKGCSELVTSAYRSSFFSDSNSPWVASARAGNVIGGGDWAKDRLIPDILTAFEQEKPVVIRNPKATRPWQHVLEPLTGYLVLSQNLYENGISFAEGWNFGPRDSDVRPVDYVIKKMASTWGDGASWALDSNHNYHEAQLLKLDISKATENLNWQPKWNLDTTLTSIVEWHKHWLNNSNMTDVTINQIDKYFK